MPSDLRQLLDEAAREPRAALDVDHIRRRARRSRIGEMAGLVAVVVLLGVGAAVVASTLTTSSPEGPVITDGRDDDRATPTPTPTPPVDDGGVPIVAPAELGVDVLVPTAAPDGDGTVAVHHPDGSSTQLPIGSADASEVTIVPDDRGGFAWQPSGATGGSPPITHVGPDGEASVVVGPTTDPAETYTLVGNSEGGTLLVTHRRGNTPQDMTVDLLEIDPADSGSRVLAEAVAGWESVIGEAVALEHSVYTMAVEASSLLVVNPPDGDPITVFEGGEAAGEYAVGVGMTDDAEVLGLIDVASGDTPTARLEVIDPFGAALTGSIDVPLRPDTDDQGIRAGGISVAGSTAVVNRTVDGQWLRPLVYDLRGGTWSVLDVAGRAFVAQPTASGDEADEPACVDDTDRVNAPPTGGDQLDLYLLCNSGAMWENAFRLDSDVARSGDTAADARAILERVFQGATADQRDRGYSGLDPQVGTGTIAMRDVTFADGTLTIDFDFPQSGVGNYNTSAGGMVWHQLILANVLQIEEIERIELLADGSCEQYTAAFEGTGCANLGRADAPWNREG